MVILDTNIIIDHLRLNSPEDSLFIKLLQKETTSELGISIISLQELYAGKSTRKKSEEVKMLSILKKLFILSYTFETAVLAGVLVRESSYKMYFADSAIAATALLNKAPLATLNIKDFDHIPNLSLYNLNSL